MKRMFLGAAWAMASAIAVPAGAIDYYFSPSGNDLNPGTSPAYPFASLSKLNTLSLSAGDRVLLQGGATFPGNIYLPPSSGGTSSTGVPLGDPITVTSYGAGRATINASDSFGLYARNTGNIQVQNLNFVGSGSYFDTTQNKVVFNNTANGIRFFNDAPGNVKFQNILIDQVSVRGFGENGISVASWNAQSGFDNVRITNSVSHDNQIAGISMHGDWNDPNRNAHTNVYIGSNKVFNNFGEDGAPDKGNSGNGIVIGQVNGAILERNVAHHNGLLCASTQGGAVGIWAWDSNRVIIQFNESYANGTAGHHDGGGFDLDGGVTNSIMQYNYSHDNDGAGFLLAQYAGARPFDNNIVRYNISQNDGRKNGYGGIHLFSKIDNTDIYNNTVFMSPAPSADLRPDGAPPAAVKFRMFTGSNVRFFNNLLMVEYDDDPGTINPLLLVVSDGNGGLVFRRNAYWRNGESGFVIARDAEAVYLDMSNLHGLFGPIGHGPTFDNADDLANLIEYMLTETSPLIDAGLDLRALYGIDVGPHDFFGIAPHGFAFDIGASEGPYGAPIIPEPSTLISLGLLAVGLLRRRRRHTARADGTVCPASQVG